MSLTSILTSLSLTARLSRRRPPLSLEELEPRDTPSGFDPETRVMFRGPDREAIAYFPHAAATVPVSPAGLVTFVGPVTPAQRARVTALIGCIPPAHLETLQAAGGGITVFAGRLTDVPALRSLAGLLLFDGRVIDDLPGFATGKVAYFAAWADPWVLFHEFGHAFDAVTGGRSGLPSWAALLAAHPIPLPDGPGWETLSGNPAEAFAIVYSYLRLGRVVPAPLADFVGGF